MLYNQLKLLLISSQLLIIELHSFKEYIFVSAFCKPETVVVGVRHNGEEERSVPALKESYENIRMVGEEILTKLLESD